VQPDGPPSGGGRHYPRVDIPFNLLWTHSVPHSPTTRPPQGRRRTGTPTSLPPDQDLVLPRLPTSFAQLHAARPHHRWRDQTSHSTIQDHPQDGRFLSPQSLPTHCTTLPTPPPVSFQSHTVPLQHYSPDRHGRRFTPRATGDTPKPPHWTVCGTKIPPHPGPQNPHAPTPLDILPPTQDVRRFALDGSSRPLGLHYTSPPPRTPPPPQKEILTEHQRNVLDQIQHGGGPSQADGQA